MLLINVVAKIKAHILCSITFFLSKIVLLEIKWKNSVESERPHVITWRTLIASWIPKATDTLRLCNKYWFYTTIMQVMFDR